MTEILDLWDNNKAFFNSKKLPQIIAMTGDGNIENENTYMQFRELLKVVPTVKLKLFAEECLQGFDKSGFALQDVVNEVGRRLGFSVTNGRYRGSHNRNGYDGLWQSNDNAIIIETKTTDAYRINLNTLDKYKSMLQTEKPDLFGKISCLIVAGRQDTGDLEAQIRGSRFAWDVRLLSIDSLMKMLDLKETFNDNKTIRQIYEVLRPQEYTRLDKLIDLIFLSVQDAELATDIDETSSMEDTSFTGNVSQLRKEKSDERANFYDSCVEKLDASFSKTFIKISRTMFAVNTGEIGVVVNVSKRYEQGGRPKYWFAYHPHYKNNLADYQDQYILYGCGSAENSFLLPLSFIEDNIRFMWHTARKDESMYWHINIFGDNEGKHFLQIPLNDDANWIDISSYRL